METKYKKREILQGCEETIFDLVRDRATPTQWGEWLRAPLEHAAAAGDAKLVKCLLSAGANAEAGWEGCHGRTLLCAAAKGGEKAVVLALLEAGARPDLNVNCGRRKWSALHHAAAGGHGRAASALIRAGADMQYADIDQRSPLHLASAGNHERLVGDLLTGGAFANAKDKCGETPLHIAAAYGHDSIVSTLLLKGADMDIKDHEQRSPLHRAILGGHANVAQTLLTAGADVTSRYEPFKLSALDVAASLGKVDILRILIRHGADANARHPNGMTVLHTAAFNNSTDVIKVLLEVGADVEVRDAVAGSTPLYGAAQSCSCDAMRVLLQHKAQVDAETACGWRPLTIACRFLNVEALELLLRWGADETGVDSKGRSAKRMVGRDVPERLRQLRTEDIERVNWLLARASLYKSWRRRGLLLLCRAFPDEAPIQLHKNRVINGAARPGPESTHRTAGCDETPEDTSNVIHDDANTGTIAISEVIGEQMSGHCATVHARVVRLEQDYLFRNISSFL